MGSEIPGRACTALHLRLMHGSLSWMLPPWMERTAPRCSPWGTFTSSLSWQLTSSRGLPCMTHPKCVMLITTQLPVCPLPSLIPHTLNRCGNPGTWSLRWVCGTERQEPKSLDWLPSESPLPIGVGTVLSLPPISPTPTDWHRVALTKPLAEGMIMGWWMNEEWC